ncbi:protein sprint isoform X2 [Malaya genurostris]|uniref:protein sprint isoform X2 n=1 Tax=Malaya genurostris TaxID=325434 RepID=UPI0026F3C971|nr:protein sprint isoform X2 [Malaya genurostris]
MKWFKKWWHGKSGSQNNNPIKPDTGTHGASGYDRANSSTNSPTSNSLRFCGDIIASCDNRNGKHADKSGLLRSSHQLQLDADGGCDCYKSSSRHSPRPDNRALAATGQFFDRGGCCGCFSNENTARSSEYGMKSITVASHFECNIQNSIISTSINDDLELLNLEEYEIINLEDFITVEESYSALEYFVNFGGCVEYGLTLDQFDSTKISLQLVEDSRQIQLDVLDALNRSLMGPLYQPQPKTDSWSVDSSNSFKAANSMMQHESVNVQELFGLDDCGNITIGVSHIEEERGECVYFKKRYQKCFRKFERAEEVSEGTKFRLTWRQLIRKILICLRCVSEGHPRNKTVFSGPGETIGMYALSLADDTESTFSRNILNFISCTKESKAAPQVVMRNMRQFMSGMKNYLVKHGEGDFAAEVQKARSQLKSDEFLNLDSILEEVMHRLVILPLREHLYGLFVDYYTQSGDIQLLVEKVKQTSGRGPMVFGIKNTVTPPSASALRQISTLFVRLQEAELPLEKLDLLLTAVSTIFEATNCANGQQLSADDFLPVLVQVVAHCGFIGAEIEAEYMWGLIQPSLLSGEAGYYLTALCSAVHVLKNFSLQEHEGVSGSVEWTSPTFPECSSVLRVIIPDEYNGSIQTRTLPIRPHTTTREVCRIIAHKARITNAQDYGLFKLIDGEETLLQDNECPQDVRMAACGKHCMIAYKRVDAKIAWPTVMPTTLTDSNQ